jgi:hypothetical protein
MRNRSKLLARACLLFVLPALLPAPSVAGDPEFHSLVQRVSAYYQKRPMRFMGLLDFVANRFTPHGVSHFEMAIFEDVDSSRVLPAVESESFVQGLFDVIDTIDDFAEMLVNWLFDRISLTTADVTLTIWTVRD